MMGVMSYGAVLSYLLILKDSLADVVGVDEDNIPMRRALLVAVSLAVVVPLSARRDMADLAFTSRLNVLIDSCLVGLVVYNAPSQESIHSIGGWKHLVLNDTIHYDTIFVGLGVLSFAFVCQHSAFIIAGSLERPTVARWSAVSGFALVVCACLALTCGIAGYTGYLDATRGNILNNMAIDSSTANVARGMLGVTMLFVYPLESFVLRHVFVVLFFQGRRAHEGEDSAILNRRDRRIGLTVILYICAVVPAAVFEDLGVVLALTGAIGGSSLSYIGPGMVYLGVHGERFLELVKTSWLGSVLSPENSTTSKNGDSSNRQKDAGSTSRESLAAVETTPLTAKTTNQQQRQQPLQEEFWLLTAVKTVMWYLLLMPGWCWIARTGKKGLSKHVHDMALKSPHPIRIGDVEYHRTDTATTLGSLDNDDAANVEEAHGFMALRREGSLPLDPAKAISKQQQRQPAVIAVSPHAKPKLFKSTGETTNIDQMLGKEILQRKRQQQQQRPRALEKDPQEQPPSWYDFYVAIFYMLFGVLALFAGLLSLATRPA